MVVKAKVKVLFAKSAVKFSYKMNSLFPLWMQLNKEHNV